jgi:hypothetical protein
VTDASDIETYWVAIEVFVENWGTAHTGSTRETIYTPNMDYSSTFAYRWQVAALDGAGNQGEPSAWRYYFCFAQEP